MAPELVEPVLPDDDDPEDDPEEPDDEVARVPEEVVPFEVGTKPDWRTLFGFARVANPTAGENRKVE